MNVISSRELVERLRATLPLVLDLADPVTGAPFAVNRDNVLALLAIDVDNLVLESQTVAMLFGEMARVHAAVRLAKEQADVEFRQWKSRKAAEARRTLDNGKTKDGERKPPTGDQVEEHYRSDPDYNAQYLRVNRAAVLVDLVGDLKEAFKIKQRLLHDLHGVTFGHDRVQVVDDRMREMESLVDEESARGMADAAAALDAIRSGARPDTSPSPQAAEPAPSKRTPRKPRTGESK